MITTTTDIVISALYLKQQHIDRLTKDRDVAAVLRDGHATFMHLRVDATWKPESDYDDPYDWYMVNCPLIDDVDSVFDEVNGHKRDDIGDSRRFILRAYAGDFEMTIGMAGQLENRFGFHIERKLVLNYEQPKTKQAAKQ